MSTTYCIDKILEKPYQPKAAKENVIMVRENPISRSDERLNEDVPQYRVENTYIVHVPREYRRPVYASPYRSMLPVCNSRTVKCPCANCIQDIPSWIKEQPRYIAVDKTSAYYGHLRYPYLGNDERDQTALVRSTLATRVRQQPCLSATGGSKRKKRHRTAFTPTQLLGLENAFDQNHYSVGDERKQLASFLGLSETQIKVWFQNRRTKWKRLRKEADEVTSDEGEQESEAEDMQYEMKHPHYNIHDQHHVRLYRSNSEQYSYDKAWPTPYFCGDEGRHQY